MTDTPVSQKKDSSQILFQYWTLSDAEHPTSRDISFTDDNGILFQCGIVFMTDSTVLENPAGDKSYGALHKKGKNLDVTYNKNRKAVYHIKRLHADEMVLDRTENGLTSQLTYHATDTWWPDASKNPFAKENYRWSFKPSEAETDDQLKTRLREFVEFFKYYFDGYVNGGATKIDFTGIPCCLNWYQGGITIQNEEKLDKKWINCFYSKAQALKARQILEDTLMKKYNWDTKETNWVKQTASVLQQIHNNL